MTDPVISSRTANLSEDLVIAAEYGYVDVTQPVPLLWEFREARREGSNGAAKQLRGGNKGWQPSACGLLDGGRQPPMLQHQHVVLPTVLHCSSSTL